MTLHHFTNPQWFARRGGWLAEDAPLIFARYVREVSRRVGGKVRFWITINEPMVYVYYGYVIGSWPPGERSFDAATRVLRNLLIAHVRAYQELHSICDGLTGAPVSVSIAKHLTHFAPCRKNSLSDRFAVFLRNQFFNAMCFSALSTGFLFFPGVFCERLPGERTLDFLGVNYYRRDFIRFGGLRDQGPLGEICEDAHHAGQIAERNSMGWEIYPEGLYRVLAALRRFSLPVLICENGVATDDDTQRVRFIESHVQSIERVRSEGLDVSGYLYWSLFDNFEWAEGYKPRFGIVEVGAADKTRKVRPSAHVLSRVCR